MASPHFPSTARLSTYSGAPSLQPSLAPTFDSASNRSARDSQITTTHLAPHTTLSEKGCLSYTTTRADPAASTSTISSSDPRAADIRSWSGALERMQDERLDKQRYVMSGAKDEEVSKISLGAKVERALARRMSGQDAVFRAKKTLDLGGEKKRNVAVQAR